MSERQQQRTDEELTIEIDEDASHIARRRTMGRWIFSGFSRRQPAVISRPIGALMRGFGADQSNVDFEIGHVVVDHRIEFPPLVTVTEQALIYVCVMLYVV